MEVLSKKAYLELKKKIEPIGRLALHDDADGISSAVLLTYVFDVNEVWAPEDFGVWEINPKKGTVPDACVDMVPANPLWNGKLCIDHHIHPPEEKRNYKLIWGEVPTGIIIFSLFKNFIPKEHWWKCAVSAVGDGVPEVIPTEVWRACPELLEKTVTTYERYYKLETTKYPIYLRLAAPINAASKIPNKWYVAYQVLKNAKSPLDLFEDPALQSAKDFVAEEKKRIIKGSNAIELRNSIKIWRFSSELKLERTLAFELEQSDRITTIAVNEKTGRGSIRGVLAQLIYEHLQSNGFVASGHPGFGGLSLGPSQTVEELISCLRNLKI